MPHHLNVVHRSFLCFKSINFDIVGWDGRDAKLWQKFVLFYGVKNIYFCLDSSLWSKKFEIFSSAGRGIRQSLDKMLQSRVGRVEKFKHTSKYENLFIAKLCLFVF